MMTLYRSHVLLRALALSAVWLTVVTTSKPAAAASISGLIDPNITYTQTSNSAPATPGYAFNISANFTTPGDFNSATATYPGPGSPLSLPPSGPTSFGNAPPNFGSQAALQSTFPFGTYTITATGPAGTVTSATNYMTNLWTSAIPLRTAAKFDVEALIA